MKKLFTDYLKPYYFRISINFLVKFTGTIMDLLIPWILAYMIDSVIPTRNVQSIYLWGIAMLVCSILAISLNIYANRISSKIAGDVTQKLRNDLFEKISYLTNRQVDNFTKPSLISRLTSDTYNVHNMLGRIQRLGVRAPILLIGGILVTLTLDFALSLVLISILPFIVLLMVYVTRKSLPLFTALQEYVDDFVRIVREDISGIRVIKALSKTDTEKEKFDFYNTQVVKQEKKSSMIMAIVNPSMNLLLNLGLILVILVGAWQVNNGLTQVGKILAFLTYFTLILNAMLSISKMFIIFSKAAASANRIMIILDSDDENISSLDKILNEKEPCNQSDVTDFLTFENVSFSYHKEENNLTDISFSLKKGETLGIIGPTGAGKTTIVSLLLRFYDIDKGTIRIDGKDIRTIPVGNLRKLYGVAFQNDVIFEDTIYENIRFGRDLSDEEVQNAILYARAKEFVEVKENASEQMLHIRGANLSGGQKQRLLIARALASHPEILILDDSSSALDYKTDAALRREIKEHFQDTTTIIIAQRISSIMNADHILVLDDGQMIGYGTHEQLMTECDLYKEISHSQMGDDSNE
jgi:ATP-binding cassette subfamily B protein